MRAIRKARNLSQERFGELLGCSFQDISKYERSDKPLPEELLEKIADKLGISSDEIQKPIEEQLSEDPISYRVQALSFDVLSDQLLQFISNTLIDELKPTTGSRRAKMLHALMVIEQELRMRGAARQQVQKPEINLTEAGAEIGILDGVEDVVRADREREESRLRPGADEPSVPRYGPLPSGGKASKARPGAPGQVPR